MAGGDRTLKVTILGDARGAMTALGSLESKLDSVSGSLRNAGSHISDVGKRMSAFVTLPIAAGLGSAVKGASDLNETMSKANNVFKDSAADIQEWSKTSATAFGQSRAEALNAASTFGNLFVQLGTGSKESAELSKQMTVLASDFASFHNAAPVDVIDAMTAAFRGEYDAVQRYVPTINAAAVEQKALAMTGKATTKELTAQEKALATQTLLLQGAGDATGDFARTQDQVANKVRILSAQLKDVRDEIGMQLIPVALRLATVFSGLVESFGSLGPSTQNMILIFAGVLAAIGPVVTVVGALVTVMGLLLTPIGAVVGAAALLTVGLGALYASSETFRNGVNELAGLIGSTVKPMFDSLAQTFNEHVMPAIQSVAALIAGQLKSAIDSITEAYKRNKPEIDRIVSVIREQLMPVLGFLLSAFIRVQGFLIGAWIQAIAQAISAVLQIIGAVGRVVEAVGQMKNGVEAAIGAVVAVVGRLPGQIVAALSGLFNEMKEVGGDIIRGVIAGIESMVGTLTRKVKQIAQDAITAPFKKALEILSPSKVFYGYGQNIGKGLILGMENQVPKIANTVGGMVGEPGGLAVSASGVSAGASAGFASGGVVYNVTVVADNYVGSKQELMAVVTEELRKSQRQNGRPVTV